MEIKLFEVRDRGTCLPVAAIMILPRTKIEVNILARSGFVPGLEAYVYLFVLEGDTSTITDDYNEWRNRTRRYAHKHILLHWRELTSGDVIDVQYLLGETDAPKQSEINPPPPTPEEQAQFNREFFGSDELSKGN